MNFIIKAPSNNHFDKIIIDKDGSKKSLSKDDDLYISIDKSFSERNLRIIENDLCINILIGDLISQIDDEFISKHTPDEIKELKGFFYLIRINKSEKKTYIFNSVFSILPVYYYKNESHFLISSRCDFIIDNTNDNFAINKRYLLERALFNYSFFNDTYYKEIKLLPSNNFLELIGKNLSLVKHTDIGDFFVENPESWRSSSSELSQKFLEIINLYMPDEKFFVSFTGGFDGRSLVASASYLNKNFSTYSFGSIDSEDITIPARHAEILGIDYKSILLDEEYSKNSFIDSGKEMIERTEGNSTFSRAHYLYAAKKLSADTGYILTGNFGSELFRAMHLTGVMTSKELISYFANENKDAWINTLKTSSGLKYLKLENYSSEFEELVELLTIYKNYSGFTDPNKKFYIFVFEEIFRKYFGPEIIMQRYFLNNRTPFLDFKFITHLLKTNLAGVYSNFFEQNPVKRFKGQVLYANIIKRSSPKIYSLKTGKGYRPKDLLTFTGKLNIINSFIQKRVFKRENEEDDSFAVKASIKKNISELEKWEINTELFNKEKIKQLFNNNCWESDRNNFISMLSANYYISRNF